MVPEPVPRPDATACRTAARVLEEVTDERRRLVLAAQDDWRGPHRDAFDEDDATLHRRAGSIGDQLLVLAATFEAGL
ncbi:MAG: hypothetical protein QOJ67_1834 [Acidimicrobiaceae bacterium]